MTDVHGDGRYERLILSKSRNEMAYQTSGLTCNKLANFLFLFLSLFLVFVVVTQLPSSARRKVDWERWMPGRGEQSDRAGVDEVEMENADFVPCSGSSFQRLSSVKTATPLDLQP